MYLRFVRLILRESVEAKFAEFYRARVIPALEATDGCLFAGLLTPWRGEAHQSLTLWESPEQARAYEASPLYQRLLREAEPFLSKKTEWRVRLGKDPLATIDPSLRAAARLVATSPRPEPRFCERKGHDRTGQAKTRRLRLALF